MDASRVVQRVHKARHMLHHACHIEEVALGAAPLLQTQTRRSNDVAIAGCYCNV